MRLDYFLYMAEAEGMTDIVDTRTAKINAATRDFITAIYEGKDPNNLISPILEKYGLEESDLTPAEINRIESQVNRYFI